MKNIDLAVQALFNFFVVVDNAVVRRLRQRQDSRTNALIFDEGVRTNFLLNLFNGKLFFRNRSDDAVLIARGRLKDGNGSRERNGVQNRLMAIAIDNDHVARRHGIVPNNLIGSRRAVRNKKEVVAPEDACRIFLGLGHRARVFQKLPEFFNGITDIRAQHVFAEKLMKHLPDRAF